MTDQACDVLVIGGGPAGASSAIFSALKGHRVILLDQAKFPRDKVCGEFISPAADDLLEALGVLPTLEEQSPVRLEGVALSAYGEDDLCLDYPARQQDGKTMTSLSLPRMKLDALLLDRAREVGVDVREQHRVQDFVIEKGRVTGVHGLAPDRKPFSFSAKVAVDAGGRNCLSIRKFNLAISKAEGNKIALAAHWQNVPGFPRYCFMHVSPPGYTGMAEVDGGDVNVVLVVDHSVVQGRDIDEAYREIVLSNPKRRALLKGTVLKEKVRSVSSLAYEVQPVPVDGLVLVGDAMGFIDPFTGEGIYLSLRSSQLAVDAIHQGLSAGNFARSHLLRYEKNRDREFGGKFVLSRILQKAIYSRFLCRQLVRLLTRRPDLAEPLVAVIGDYLPAKKVVQWRYLARLLWAWVSNGWGVDSSKKGACGTVNTARPPL